MDLKILVSFLYFYVFILILSIVSIFVGFFLYNNFLKLAGRPPKTINVFLKRYSLLDILLMSPFFHCIEFFFAYPLYRLLHDKRIPKFVFKNVYEKGFIDEDYFLLCKENEAFVSLLKNIKNWKLENDLVLNQSIDKEVKILYDIAFKEQLKRYKSVLK